MVCIRQDLGVNHAAFGSSASQAPEMGTEFLEVRLSRAQIAFSSSSLFCSLVGSTSSHKVLPIDRVTALMYS